MTFLNNLVLGLRLSKEADGSVYLHDKRDPLTFIRFPSTADAYAEYDRRQIAYRQTSPFSIGF